MEVAAGPSVVRIGGENGASFSTVSKPLILHIKPSHLAKLPKKRRAIVNQISTTARQALTEWDQFSFQLPQSQFVTDPASGQTLAPLISVADLCTQPDDTDELAEITIDPDTGERRRLTPEQFADITEYGRFSFPSRRFPRISHVWQLPSWMVRGRKNKVKDFNRRLGNALDHVLVYCPNRIYHKRKMWEDDSSLSIASGIRRIGRQMKGIVAAFVGLPETVPRRREYKHRKLAEEQYIRDKSSPDELHDVEVYLNPSPATARYSIRFEDEQASAYDETYRLAAIQTFQHVSPEDLSTYERVSRIDVNWLKEKREREVQQVIESEDDEQKRLILAEYVRARHIIEDGEDKLQARTKREMPRFIEEAKQTHPVLSLSRAWLERRLAQKAVHHYVRWQHEQEDENIALMRSAGLHRAAKIEEARLQFQREAWPDIRAEWLRDRVGAREYEHAYVIFNPRRWRKGPDRNVRFVRTTTAHAGWRLVLLWRDMISMLRTGVYFTVVTNLWRGPVGIQALFSWKDVPYSWSMDADGVAQPRAFRLSMYTRLRAIWRRVGELRRAFEEGEDSIFGKDAVRWLHFIINYGFRGVVSSALVLIGQPLLTVVNAAATAVITATSVLWAPFSALLTYCTSWLLYDWRSFDIHNVEFWFFNEESIVYIREFTEHSPKWFPLPSRLLYGVFGALEACLGVAGVVLHPVYAIIRSSLACVQRGVRVLWDGMWHTLLRRFGRWPVRDSFLAQRVGGVGVSGCYYFRLSTDLVTRCMRARLELIELEEAHDIIAKAAAKPTRDLELFTEDVLTGLCEGPGRWKGAMVRLQKEERRRMKDINKEFRRRMKILSRLTIMPQGGERIRPEKGVAPELVFQKCVEIVEKFYEERIAKLGEASTRLWREAGAEPGDLKTLTRYLLADLFSEEFLAPVETSEETLEIPVTFDDVINVYPVGKRHHEDTHDDEYEYEYEGDDTASGRSGGEEYHLLHQHNRLLDEDG